MIPSISLIFCRCVYVVMFSNRNHITACFDHEVIKSDHASHISDLWTPTMFALVNSQSCVSSNRSGKGDSICICHVFGRMFLLSFVYLLFCCTCFCCLLVAPEGRKLLSAAPRSRTYYAHGFARSKDREFRSK